MTNETKTSAQRSEEEDALTPDQRTPGGDEERPATVKRHTRAESSTWQAIERVGKSYLHTSKRIAQLLSALKER